MLRRRTPRWCLVSLYGLEVEVEHAEWPERGQRMRAWFSQEAAANQVDEPDLRGLIAAFAP